MKRILLVSMTLAGIALMPVNSFASHLHASHKADNAYWWYKKHHHCRIEEGWRQGRPFWNTLCGWDDGRWPSY